MSQTITVKLTALILCILFCVAPISAKPKKILDKKFLLTVGLAVAATIADVETTKHCLQFPACMEGNLVYGTRPSRGKLYAINAPVTGLTVFLAYAMKHEGMDKTFWIPLAPVIAIHGHAAIHNFRGANRIERLCPTASICPSAP